MFIGLVVTGFTGVIVFGVWQGDTGGGTEPGDDGIDRSRFVIAGDVKAFVVVYAH